MRSLLPICLALCAGCASAGKDLTKAAQQLNATLLEGDVIVAAGDTIDITFPNKPDWDDSILVRPDGMASFPFLDDIVVAGKTLGQLDLHLTRAYESILEIPELSLNVSLWGSRDVIVMGQVTTPGPIPITGPRMTLLEAIGRAGGWDRRTALMKQVVLVRWIPDRNQRQAWKIDARPDRWNDSTPIYLQPFDLVYVPNKPIDKVDIWVDQYIRQLLPFPTLVPGGGV